MYKKRFISFIVNFSLSYYAHPRYLLNNIALKFSLDNATKRTGILYATDDLNGAADRNAELITTLNAREIYYVVVYNYNENYGCTLFFGDNKTIIGGLEIM